jgi:hypothetical protein
MKHYAWLLGGALSACSLTGCVERRYVVYTDPPGAVVLHNNTILGQSPVDDHFTYYGNHHFTIFAEGYETLQVDQEITTPWYQYFPLDFISEVLVPWQITDRRVFRYQLEPRRIVNTNELLQDAQNLRNRGISLGAGSAQPAVVVPSAATPTGSVPESPPSP